MPLAVALPAYLTARSVRDAVSTVGAAQQIRWADQDVEVCADNLLYADPFGMAILGASFHCLRQGGHAIQVRGLNSDIRSYLERMNVFQGVELEASPLGPRQRHNREDSLVELTSIGEPAQVDGTAQRLARALIGRGPNIDFDEPPDEMTGYTRAERLMEPLQYALSELLENALTHARREGRGEARVWVASQYYPKRDRLSVGVVDNGCGFLATLRSHPALTAETHHGAILAALQPRVSCNRDLGVYKDTVNQGVGLTTTSRIADSAGGRLSLISGNGFHDTAGGPSGTMEAGAWSGVAIALECSRERLAAVRFRELLPPLDDLPRPPLRFE